MAVVRVAEAPERGVPDERRRVADPERRPVVQQCGPHAVHAVEDPPAAEPGEPELETEAARHGVADAPALFEARARLGHALGNRAGPGDGQRPAGERLLTGAARDLNFAGHVEAPG